MPIIVVSGIPRSGTSMMMQMLEAGGVACFYAPYAGDEFNPRGYYEASMAMLGELAMVPDGWAVKCLHKLPSVVPDLDARVIIMRRQMRRVLASADRMAQARGVPLEKTFELARQLDAIRLWCADRPHIEAWYEDALTSPMSEALRVSRFLGRDLDVAAMAAIPKVT